MKLLALNLPLAAWLLYSAFTLTQTALSSMIALVVALAVAALSWVAEGKSTLRTSIAGCAVILLASALLLPGVEWPARMSDALVAAAFIGLALAAPKPAPREPISDIASSTGATLFSQSPARPPAHVHSTGGRALG